MHRGVRIPEYMYILCILPIPNGLTTSWVAQVSTKDLHIVQILLLFSGFVSPLPVRRGPAPAGAEHPLEVCVSWSLICGPRPHRAAALARGPEAPDAGARRHPRAAVWRGGGGDARRRGERGAVGVREPPAAAAAILLEAFDRQGKSNRKCPPCGEMRSISGGCRRSRQGDCQLKPRVCTFLQYSYLILRTECHQDGY